MDSEFCQGLSYITGLSGWSADSEFQATTLNSGGRLSAPPGLGFFLLFQTSYSLSSFGILWWTLCSGTSKLSGEVAVELHF